MNVISRKLREPWSAPAAGQRSHPKSARGLINVNVLISWFAGIGSCLEGMCVSNDISVHLAVFIEGCAFRRACIRRLAKALNVPCWFINEAEDVQNQSLILAVREFIMARWSGISETNLWRIVWWNFNGSPCQDWIRKNTRTRVTGLFGQRSRMWLDFYIWLHDLNNNLEEFESSLVMSEQRSVPDSTLDFWRKVLPDLFIFEVSSFETWCTGSRTWISTSWIPPVCTTWRAPIMEVVPAEFRRLNEETQFDRMTQLRTVTRSSSSRMAPSFSITTSLYERSLACYRQSQWFIQPYTLDTLKRQGYNGDMNDLAGTGNTGDFHLSEFARWYETTHTQSAVFLQDATLRDVLAGSFIGRTSLGAGAMTDLLKEQPNLYTAGMQEVDHRGCIEHHRFCSQGEKWDEHLSRIVIEENARAIYRGYTIRPVTMEPADVMLELRKLAVDTNCLDIFSDYMYMEATFSKWRLKFESILTTTCGSCGEEVIVNVRFPAMAAATTCCDEVVGIAWSAHQRTLTVREMRSTM